MTKTVICTKGKLIVLEGDVEITIYTETPESSKQEVSIIFTDTVRSILSSK